LLPGQLTPWLGECLVRLGAWMPFQHSAEELKYFLHVTVSESKARRDTERAGTACVAVQEAEAARLQKELPDVPAGVDRQLLSVDGAFVGLVGGDWAEVKTLSLGVINPPDAAGEVHTTDLSYFSRVSEASLFTQQAGVETHRRGVARSRHVCAVTDGAEWIQGFVDWHRPDAVRILDFYHAAEHVAAAGRAMLGNATPEFQSWFDQQRHTLKAGDPDQVLAALERLAPARGTNQSPDTSDDVSGNSVLRDTVRYLRARRDKINYAQFQQAGYPIGSGAGEACHKYVIESRLKGTGMRWAREHVNPMAALRNLVCNNRWEEGWSIIASEFRRPASRPTAAASAPATPPDPPIPEAKLLPADFKLRPGISWRNRPVGNALYLPSSERPSAKK
jgi:hypothetical protein